MDQNLLLETIIVSAVIFVVFLLFVCVMFQSNGNGFKMSFPVRLVFMLVRQVSRFGMENCLRK